MTEKPSPQELLEQWSSEPEAVRGWFQQRPKRSFFNWWHDEPLDLLDGGAEPPTAWLPFSGCGHSIYSIDLRSYPTVLSQVANSEGIPTFAVLFPCVVRLDAERGETVQVVYAPAEGVYKAVKLSYWRAEGDLSIRADVPGLTLKDKEALDVLIGLMLPGLLGDAA